MTRRHLLATPAAALLSPAAGAATRTFRFAVIADTHVIDDFYRGPENSPLDSESILKTRERLTSVRDHLNALQPAVERVFIVGDYFHDYPSIDLDFFEKNRTRIDIAKEIASGFRMPVHPGFGNHDYAVPRMPREHSHDLFRRKLGVAPYYSVEHKGWKFVHLNNFLGATWTPGHEKYNKSSGSLGLEQLEWFENELSQRKPTFVFVHYPLSLIAPMEKADYGLLPLLKKHRETVQRVISGHWHRWFEFGRSYGPQHLVIAATRYDTDAYLVVEVDTRKQTHSLLNIDSVDWNTHYSEPWRG